MSEKLGPNMARTLLGPAYNGACDYFLESDGAKLYLRIVNRTNGEVDFRALEKHELPPTEEDAAEPVIPVVDTGKGVSWGAILTMLLALLSIFCLRR